MKSRVKRDPTKPDQPHLTANRIPAERALLLWKADSSWLCCSVKAWVTSDFCKQEMNGDTEVPRGQSAGYQHGRREPTAAEVTSSQRLSWKRYFFHRRSAVVFRVIW